MFLHALVAWSRRRPALALLGGGLLGWLLYWQLTPAAPVPRPVVAKAQAVPGLGVERPVLEKTLLDVQKENAQLRLALTDQQRTLHEIQQTQANAERDRQTREQAQEKRVEDLLHRAEQAQQAARQTPTPHPQPKPQPKPVAAVPPHVEAPTDAAKATGDAKVRILRSDKAASFTGPPPSPLRAETPFLPAGSFAEGRAITGVMATSRAGGALPVLFAVTKPFTGPFQLRGSGVNPDETALPIAGCFVMGKAAADLGSSRVIIQLELLSCVFPDQAAFERPLKGFATGADGTLGIVGRVETHDSAVIAKSFLTGLLAGASESFNLAKRTTLVTPLGGTITTPNGQLGETAGFAALANAAAQLSQFYLSQASQLLPTLWVESGTAARLVLQEGLALEGLPTTTPLYAGGLP
jgi:hypothetical protein